MDFTNCEEIYNRAYDGAGGGKRCIVINGEEYMLKFPQTPTKKTELSYTNSCVSEYIGCHIFELAEIPVQKTILGTYITEKGKEKIAVACKDFTFPHKTLHTFTGLKNQVVDSPENGKGTELSAIMDAIESQKIFPPEVLKERFWDMFVVDALIGNWSRHNGDWGYLRDSNTNEVSVAPVFDCGSSLFSQMDENQMKNVLASSDEIKRMVYSNPFSVIRMNERKINYMEFINSLENEDCNRSLKKICPKLSADKIKEVVNATPYITDLQKDFYNAILEARFELILKTAYKKLLKREQDQAQENPATTITGMEGRSR